MKIAVVSDTFLPQVNGVTKTLSKLKSYMDSNGHEYRFMVPRFNRTNDILDNVTCFTSFKFFLYPECKIVLPSYISFSNQLKEFQPDLIHIATEFSLGLHGLAYAKENNIPISASYHTDFPKYLSYYNIQFLENFAWRYFKWFHSHAEVNFCPSKYTKKQLEEHGIENVKIWGRGIDTKIYTPSNRSEEERKKYGIKKSDKVLIYVGRIAPEKELDVLVNAVKTLNSSNTKFKVLMVGDGPMKKALEQQDIKNVIFTGYKSGEELRTLYASADIFAFPSSSETYGNVILEAMASGLPVVAAYEGGVRENLVDGYNGVAFKAGDSKDMSQSIKKLLNDDGLREALSYNARQHSLIRNWDKIYDNLFENYSEAIENYKKKQRQLSA